jgi:hypothetical protein
VTAPRYFLIVAGNTTTDAIDLAESRGHVIIRSVLTGQDTIRDLTTLGAKRMIALVRRISRGELDQEAVIKAREIILDVKQRQQARHRANRAAIRRVA